MFKGAMGWSGPLTDDGWTIRPQATLVFLYHGPSFCPGGSLVLGVHFEPGPLLLDCNWVGSLDFNSLVEIKLAFY